MATATLTSSLTSHRTPIAVAPRPRLGTSLHCGMPGVAGDLDRLQAAIAGTASVSSALQTAQGSISGIPKVSSKLACTDLRIAE
jgi:hypothetical protein